jgi:hypothetical protein
LSNILIIVLGEHTHPKVSRGLSNDLKGRVLALFQAGVTGPRLILDELCRLHRKEQLDLKNAVAFEPPAVSKIANFVCYHRKQMKRPTETPTLEDESLSVKNQVSSHKKVEDRTVKCKSNRLSMLVKFLHERKRSIPVREEANSDRKKITRKGLTLI